MKVDFYERIWLYAATGLIAAFLIALLTTAGLSAVHPSSHVETIDPRTVRTESEFATPGVETLDDGSVLVVVVAELYQFRPEIVRVPAGVPVRFRLTSPDVIHGFQIAGTNVNAMVAPGYVSETTVTFDRPGEYLVVCNEYCGLSHHLMQGRVVVTGGEAP
jgi:cytochrome c oxidase subunit 2